MKQQEIITIDFSPEQQRQIKSEFLEVALIDGQMDKFTDLLFAHVKASAKRDGKELTPEQEKTIISQMVGQYWGAIETAIADYAKYTKRFFK